MRTKLSGQFLTSVAQDTGKKMPHSHTVFFNGLRIELSALSVTAYVQDVMESRELKRLREKLEDSWFLYWRDGRAYGLPRIPTPKKQFGTATELKCEEHLWLIAARIADVLPEKFPRYKVRRRRPFTFIGLKDEIVQIICERMPELPSVVSRFKIRPKFELDAKLVEPRDGELFIGLFMTANTRWEIEAPLEDLVAAGVDIKGLYVVRRDPLPGQNRLVGRISGLANGRVTLSDSYDDTTQIESKEVWLEGSRASFSRCLKKLLGNQYQAFEKERLQVEATFFTGPAVEKLLKTMGDFLRKASPITIADGLTCSITDRLKISNSPEHQSVVSAQSALYCFDPARTKRSQYAWPGIERFGPFSKDTFAKKSPKILVLFPDTVQGKVENFLRLFRDGISLPPSFRNPAFSAGFAKTFGLINVQFILRRIPWLSNTGSAAQAYRNAAEEYLTNEQETPDAAIVVILNEHADLPDSESPYLHSKAVLMMAGIPVQQVRLPTMVQAPEVLQSTLQNISIALYAKMNGTPWTVDHDLTITDEIVIGIGMCELSSSRFRRRQRYIGITTVFRGDGNYLLGNLSKECSFDEYPDVLRDSTLSILREIKSRSAWLPNDTVRVVFHSYKPLRNVEMDRIMAECVQTVGSEQNMEFAFLTVSHDHPFAIMDLSQEGYSKNRSGAKKAVYVPERGTIVRLGRFTRLLATSGPTLIKRVDAPLPHPLLIHLHPYSTFRSLDYLAEQVLKFTSLSWRSTLPARKPVTIYYSELIAEELARLRNVPDWSPAALNLKLRASRWFL